MKKVEQIMGMPITVEVLDTTVTENDLRDIFNYFRYVDEKFSTYKATSEISQINNGSLKRAEYSDDMREVLRLSEITRQETNGFFNIEYEGTLDPSGLVKGWAIYNAAQLLKQKGFGTFYVDAGGDIQAEGKFWKIGIRNPFNQKEIVKVIAVRDRGVATSGTYNRGQHVYNPHEPKGIITDIISLTVIGPNVYEADRFATAAFAMGKQGIQFIESLSGFEGYAINTKGIATYTSSFNQYVEYAKTN